MNNHRTPRPSRSRPRNDKSPYFMQPGKGGVVAVFHRPVGNRVAAKLCGTMPNRPLAIALIQQLERAESAVSDLFLEATDDGIEALEAVLQACCTSVLERAARRGDAPQGSNNNNRRRHPRGRQQGRPGRGRPMHDRDSAAGDSAYQSTGEAPAPTPDAPANGDE